MGKALYRKYRSKRLSEIVGQPYITNALAQALAKGSISHAYLFTGPRGVGKTSIARILAHEVNELPYTDESSHLDIIEIDAASNRGIEDVRELRDKVHVAPTSAKFKVYIIDEIHMLTTPAFNALLKTLEEPPAHVIFILATTEMHKLPETIVSRTQHFSFKPVAQSEVVSHLKSIAEEEKIAIDDEALKLVADYGGGSFRDSISLLDQASNYGETITGDIIRQVIGVAPESAITAIVKAIAEHQPATVVQQLSGLQEKGIEASSISRQITLYLQNDMLQKTPTIPPHTSLALVRSLIEVPGSLNPAIALEVILLQAAFEPTIAAHVAHPTMASHHVPATTKSKEELAVPKQPVAPKTEKATKVAKTTSKPLPGPEAPVAQSVDTAAVATPDTSSIPEPTSDTMTSEEWSAVMLHVKQKYNTLYGILRMAEADIQPGKVVLKLRFAFHQKRLNDPKNKDIVIQAIETTTKHRVVLECIVAEDAKPNLSAQPSIAPAGQGTAVAESSTLGAISNIFGGGELLES